jgi:hypothetical protein
LYPRRFNFGKLHSLAHNDRVFLYTFNLLSVQASAADRSPPATIGTFFATRSGAIPIAALVIWSTILSTRQSEVMRK